MNRTLLDLCYEVGTIVNVDVARAYEYAQEYYNTDRKIDLDIIIEKDYDNLKQFIINKVNQ